MLRLLPKFLPVIFLSTVLFFAACKKGVDLNDPDDNPALKKTVLSVSASYLQHISVGRKKRLNSLVLWGDYLKVSKNGLTKVEYFKQMQRLHHSQFPDINAHPLAELNVIELDVDESHAKVEFKKRGDNAETIWVELFWTGNGWMIVDDSIFGEDSVVSRLNAP